MLGCQKTHVLCSGLYVSYPYLDLKTHTSGFAVGLLVIGAIFQCNERNLRDVSDRILAYLNSNDQRSVCIAVVSFCDEGMAQNSTVGTVFFFFFFVLLINSIHVRMRHESASETFILRIATFLPQVKGFYLVSVLYWDVATD